MHYHQQTGLQRDYLNYLYKVFNGIVPVETNAPRLQRFLSFVDSPENFWAVTILKFDETDINLASSQREKCVSCQIKWCCLICRFKYSGKGKKQDIPKQ